MLRDLRHSSGLAEHTQDRVSFTREKDYSGSEQIDIEFHGLDGVSREIASGPRLTLKGLSKVLFPTGSKRQ